MSTLSLELYEEVTQHGETFEVSVSVIVECKYYEAEMQTMESPFITDYIEVTDYNDVNVEVYLSDGNLHNMNKDITTGGKMVLMMLGLDLDTMIEEDISNNVYEYSKKIK